MARHLHDVIKQHIVRLKERGYTFDEIANIYEVDRSTIVRIIKNFKINGSVKRKKGTGKPNKYNINDIIKNILKNDRTLTIRQITAIIKKRHKISCSYSTIHNRIKKMGYNKKSPIIKPHLSEKQLNDREYWAIFYNEFDWTNVIWSDETAISIIPNKYSKVWVHKDDGPFIKKTFNNRLKLNVWGCIIKGYGLVVHIYDKTMNGDKYIETLKLKLIPFIKKLHKNGKTNLIFQQDNATVHTSLKVVKFMSDKKIEVMFWPANSPDLNPIENVWHLLKNNIGKVFITNKEELTKLILKTARSLDIQIINNLVDSMDNRINKLFSNNFDSIRY